MKVTVGATKKTKHGGYGQILGSVVVEVESKEQAHAAALPLLKVALPGLKITTDILSID